MVTLKILNVENFVCNENVTNFYTLLFCNRPPVCNCIDKSLTVLKIIMGSTGNDQPFHGL
jgi:hypothetical protein